MFRFAILCVLALLAGCHNAKEFDRPAPETLRLGQMTRQEIVAAYGEPTRQESTTISAGGGTSSGQPGLPADLTVVKLTYSFRNPALVVLDPAGFYGAKKFIVFIFANDRLVAYNFTSTFSDDHMDFDEKKVTSLDNGKTTREEVMALFGPPGGRAIFPAAPAGVELYTYDHPTIEGPAGAPIRREKRLEVSVVDGIVRDFRFTNGRTPVPGGGTTVVPVFIPRGR